MLIIQHTIKVILELLHYVLKYILQPVAIVFAYIMTIILAVVSYCILICISIGMFFITALVDIYFNLKNFYYEITVQHRRVIIGYIKKVYASIRSQNENNIP